MSAGLKKHLECQITAMKQNKFKRPAGFAYSSVAEFLLARGKSYSRRKLTRPELTIVLNAAKGAGNDFRQKECYFNAQRLALSDLTGTLCYVEGLCEGVIPFSHGWATINGKVIDLTLRTASADKYARPASPFADRIIGDFPKLRGYWGVEISTDVLIDTFSERESAGPLIDDWEHGYPLLRSA